MFTSLASLGLLIVGLGRIGMSVLNFLFNYLIKKQEIKLKELSLKEEFNKKDKSENSSNHIFCNQNKKYEEGNNPSSNSSINTYNF